jgi:MFS family permease
MADVGIDTAPATGAEGNTRHDAVKLSPKLTAYLIGQCCNVVKVALWWTALSPLVLALTGRDESIGSVRVAFNVAMMLISPFAGVLAERTEIRKTLIWTTVGRGFIWAIMLPVIYAFLSSGLIGSSGIESPEATLGALVVLGLLDGSQVCMCDIGNNLCFFSPQMAAPGTEYVVSGQNATCDASQADSETATVSVGELKTLKLKSKPTA